MSKPKTSIDLLTALYPVKTPEEIEQDERQVKFFRHLLNNKTIEELLKVK